MKYIILSIIYIVFNLLKFLWEFKLITWKAFLIEMKELPEDIRRGINDSKKE